MNAVYIRISHIVLIVLFIAAVVVVTFVNIRVRDWVESGRYSTTVNHEETP